MLVIVIILCRICELDLVGGLATHTGSPRRPTLRRIFLCHRLVRAALRMSTHRREGGRQAGWAREGELWCGLSPGLD